MEYNLWNEIQAKTKQLDYSVKELRKSGTAYAEAERDYQIEKANTALRLKAEGKPVGIVSIIVKGVPTVANRLFKRIAAEAVYKANMEAINALKLEIRILDNQLQREWGTPQANM